MAKRKPTTNITGSPSYVLPQWDLQRRHRLLLDQRVRSVRRYLLAGGLIGTVAFSALAGYETKVASGSTTAAQPATEASTTQAAGASFFANQSSAVLGTPTATATSSPASTATPATAAAPNAEATTAAALEATQTVQANTAATETAEANTAATQTAQANAAAVETAAAIPTDTPVPTEALVVAPQTHTRTQSSN